MTQTKAKKAEPEAIPAESPEAPSEKKWARKGSISPQKWLDLELPVLKEWIRVRYVTNSEAMRVAHLPDIARFAELMAEHLRNAQEGEVAAPEVIAGIEQERVAYLLRVAHLCVMDPEESPDPRACGECHFDHPPSLWTVEQVDFLDQRDLRRIAEVAERQADLEAVRPFSQDETPSDSPSSASTGESIPPTS